MSVCIGFRTEPRHALTKREPEGQISVKGMRTIGYMVTRGLAKAGSKEPDGGR
jgi:hypothetical protein